MQIDRIINEYVKQTHCCDEMSELIYKFGVIDIANFNGRRVYQMIIGKKLLGDSIYQQIKFCPQCGKEL